MDTQTTLLAALHADPRDVACWFALADCLEENGESERGELLRLRLALQTTNAPGRGRKELRLRQLINAGVRTIGPELVNSLGMRLVLVPPGSFWMGSPPQEPGRHHDEDPRHRVELTKPFYLGVYQVTQRQFYRVMQSNPSHFSPTGEGAESVGGLDTSIFPVERVLWSEAVQFCARLSGVAEEVGRKYRLPTEAEWEYACRAGTTTLFHHGDSLTSDRANIDGNLPEGEAPRGRYLARTCPVGQFPPNAFGLYDMHGNVWEWCQDWFDEGYYPESPSSDPSGPGVGTRRALRGGGWFYGARIARSAYRYRFEPEYRHYDFGMRVVMECWET